MLQPIEYVADFKWLGEAGSAIGSLVGKYPELKRLDEIAKDEERGKEETKEAVISIADYIANDPAVLDAYSTDLNVTPEQARQSIMGFRDNVLKGATTDKKSADYMSETYKSLEDLFKSAPSLAKNGGMIAHNIANGLPAGTSAYVENKNREQVADILGKIADPNTPVATIEQEANKLGLQAVDSVAKGIAARKAAEGEAATKAKSMMMQNKVRENIKGLETGSNGAPIPFDNYNDFFVAVTNGLDMNDEAVKDMVKDYVDVQWKQHELASKNAIDWFNAQTARGRAKAEAKREASTTYDILFKIASSDLAIATKALNDAIKEGIDTTPFEQEVRRLTELKDHYAAQVAAINGIKIPDSKSLGVTVPEKEQGKGLGAIVNMFTGGGNLKQGLLDANPGSYFEGNALFSKDKDLLGSLTPNGKEFKSGYNVKINKVSSSKQNTKTTAMPRFEYKEGEGVIVK